MPLTRDYRETVVDRIQRDREFAALLLQRALQALLERDLARARSLLRDLVHGTISFPSLAKKMGKKTPSVFRMLGEKGHPRLENLLEIIRHLCVAIGARPGVQVLRARAPIVRGRRGSPRRSRVQATA